ncbi:hypothetical protein MCOR02_001648 [Pyricularia oryzae]|nr:hypothetical protein MCOR02_001648 [Pyricularia oryzae]
MLPSSVPDRKQVPARLLKECYDFWRQTQRGPHHEPEARGHRQGQRRRSIQAPHQSILHGSIASRWYTDTKVPHLGSARGRILLVRRYHDDEAAQKRHNGRGFGIDGSHWPDNCEDGTVGSGLIRVQDFYEIDQSTNIERKIQYARAQLERAAEKRADPRGEANPTVCQLSNREQLLQCQLLA